MLLDVAGDNVASCMTALNKALSVLGLLLYIHVHASIIIIKSYSMYMLLYNALSYRIKGNLRMVQIFSLFAPMLVS